MDGVDNSMAQHFRPIYPPLPTHGPSPSLSAVRPSLLSSLGTFTISVSPFSSLPFTSTASSPSYPYVSVEVDSLPPSPHSSATLDDTPLPPSPDLLDSFEHTTEMEEGLHLIESEDEARHRNNLPPLFLYDGVPIPRDSDFPMFPTQEEEQKTWVVFHGKAPGVYPNL